MQKYRKNLLHKAIQCLVGAAGSKTSNRSLNSAKTKNSKNSSENEATNGVIVNQATGTIISNVLKYTSLLRETLNDDEMDSNVVWWCGVLELAVHWLLGEDKMANDLYESVKKLPANLSSSKNLLPKALHSILEAKTLLVL